MGAKVVYRKASDERIEVLREGDAEASYVCRPLYALHRRDEPSQVYESMGRSAASLEEAVAACIEDAREVDAWLEAQGVSSVWDGGLSFWERSAGEWVAREYDTIGCDYRIELVAWLVEDEVNGGEPEELRSPDELRAYIESEIDKGWF